MKRLLVGGIAALVLGLGVAAPAQATGPQDYYTQLQGHNLRIWDYPEMLRQGYTICDMLWNNANPMPWLMYTVGYDSSTANSVIGSAQAGLCPGNAVTS